MRKRKQEISIVRKTTFWDFLIALGSGIINLIKIDKVICIIFLYLLGRDFYFTKNLEKGEIYQQNILDAASIMHKILESESNKDILYISIIFILFIIILILIIVIKYVYMTEIQRLARERSRLMHDIRNNNFVSLKKHNSSEWEESL